MSQDATKIYPSSSSTEHMDGKQGTTNDESNRVISSSVYSDVPITGENGIRLLELLPGSLEDDIKCNLFPCDLNDSHIYFALSYTWGNDPHREAIQVNGQSFQVSRSVFDALQRLRRTLENETLCLWVDAICIDQSNIPERNDQVSMMTNIYRGAQQLIIWLGPSERHSDIAMKFLVSFNSEEQERFFDDYVYGNDSRIMLPDSLKGRVLNPPGQDGSFEVPLLGVDVLDLALCAVKDLVWRPWFNRTWVLQEFIVTNGSTILICGDWQAPWSNLERFMNWSDAWDLKRMNDPFKKFMKSHIDHQVGPFQMIRESSQHSIPSLRLEWLIGRTLAFVATDPRDKIFALIGLCCQADKDAVVPDYNKSTRQVYTDTAQYLIGSTKSLDVLSLNSSWYNNEASISEKLPSWVPDMTFGLNGTSFRVGLYNASANFMATLTEDADTDLLVCEGLFVDSVSMVTTTAFDLKGGQVTLPAIRESLNMVVNMIDAVMQLCKIGRAAGIPSYLTDTFTKALYALDPDPRKSDACWRTLVADSDLHPKSGGSERPAPASWGAMFEILLYGPGSDFKSRQSALEDLEIDLPRLLTAEPSSIPTEFQPDLPEAQRVIEYCRPLIHAMSGRLTRRTAFVTEELRLGIGPIHTQPDDKVVILLGGKLPFLLRDKQEATEGYPYQKMVGDSYIHGIMDGEYVKTNISSEDDWSNIVTFCIR